MTEDRHADPEDLHQRFSHRRNSAAGRREADTLPKATFTKKVLVVTVSVINLIYFVLESYIDNCNDINVFP